MARMNPTSHGTTGFLTTLVLTCAFAIIASALWIPPRHAATAIATGENAAYPAAAVR